MKRFKLYFYLLMFVYLQSCTPSISEQEEPREHLYEYVNTFIGTGGHGHTYPGAAAPFGMVQLSPDTRLTGWDGCGAYHYSDEYIYGFSHTHLSGTGVSDYGDILFMPTASQEIYFDNGAESENGYKSHFSHSNERANAGFYSVHLDDYHIDVELTVTERCGFHQYHFNDNKKGHIILDLEHRDKLIKSSFQLVDDQTIQGLRYSDAWAKEQRLHYYAQFSKKIDAIEYSEDSLKMAIIFNSIEKPVRLKIGISAVDIEGAKKNLEAEIPHWDFEKVKNETQEKWEKELSKIKISGGTEDQKVVFYTAMYHSFLNPNLFTDVDGRYLGMDLKVHQLPAGQKQYTIFSLWDTFRATHPLFTITQQKRTNEFIQTFIRQYEEGGELPIWELAGNYTGCMIGYHSIPVISDAYVKGIRDYDVEKALEAMIHSANQDKLGLAFYKKNGFISAENEAESVSKTLEYAYDDWCIAVMADSLGKEIASDFYKRGQYYKNLYDPSTRFLRAKNNNAWFKPFVPDEVNFNYTEANAWQYSLFAPQDIQGHIELMGGANHFETHLDQLFTTSSETSGREQVDITGLIGQYAHGNEPSHHMAYLYNYIGKPAKTQEKVHQILNEQYWNGPDGLSGNEDCGQMSSWYVLSALGIYSVSPGMDYYTLSSPLFDEAIIQLENGNEFIINKKNKGIYIQKILLNGKEYTPSYLPHQEIMKGGTITFEMSEEPTEWGTKKEAIPYSFINKNKIIPVPYFKAESQTFTEELSIEIEAINGGDIYYTTDGSAPSLSSNQYTNPILLKETTLLKAVVVKDNLRSEIIEANYYKIEGGRDIQVNSTYANQYAAAGDNTLIDYLRGGNNYRTGRWQGYREDVDVVVDLGKQKQVNKISLGVLQDIQSWIFYPTEVAFYISEDGKDFTKLMTVKNEFPDDEYGAFIQDITTSKIDVQTRYIQVKAKNYGVCPEWHLGAGGTTWIFTDEVVVE